MNSLNLVISNKYIMRGHSKTMTFIYEVDNHADSVFMFPLDRFLSGITFCSQGSQQNCANDVVLWTNHRVMEWLRCIDLSEYAPNLRGSGVHGGLMVCSLHHSSAFVH